MSIENQLAALTAAVIELTNAVKSKGNVTPLVQAAPVVAPVASAPVASNVAPNIAPVAPNIAPVAPNIAPVAPNIAPVVPAMPAPPTFAPAAPAPAPVNAPFTDGKGLIDYVMGAYKAMGAQKGAQIQTVLTGLGYQNINDVKPEHYGVLHQGIEALKAA
jgi:hypothetical protein